MTAAITSAIGAASCEPSDGAVQIVSKLAQLWPDRFEGLKGEAWSKQYGESLSDIGDGMLAEAFDATLKDWRRTTPPLPGDIRAKVSEISDERGRTQQLENPVLLARSYREREVLAEQVMGSALGRRAIEGEWQGPLWDWIVMGHKTDRRPTFAEKFTAQQNGVDADRDYLVLPCDEGRVERECRAIHKAAWDAYVSIQDNTDKMSRHLIGIYEKMRQRSLELAERFGTSE